MYKEGDSYLIATEETMYDTFPGFVCCCVPSCTQSGRMVEAIGHQHVCADGAYLSTLDLDDEEHAQLVLAWYMDVLAGYERDAGDEETAELFESAAHEFRYER